MATKRSGWTNVRMCNDCQQQISEGDICGCPNLHPFRRGVLVTVCADEARTVPVRLAEVGRMGNGAFRLHATKDWYDFNGDPQPEDSKLLRKGGPEALAAAKRKMGYVRLRTLEDAVRLDEQQQRRALYHCIETWEREHRSAVEAEQRCRSAAVRAERDAAEKDTLARVINPQAAGEAARKKAEDEALAKIKTHQDAAAEARLNRDKMLAEAEQHAARRREAQAKLNTLPNDVQGVRLLGNADALRAYLLGP
jgi:hypothetical protein